MIAKQPKILYKELHDLFKTGKSRQREIGYAIYSPVIAAKKIYYLEEGAIRIFNYENGEKKTKLIIFKNDLFGVEGFFGEKYHSYYAEPLTKEVYYRTLALSDFELKLKISYKISHNFFTYLENQKQLWHNRFFLKSYNSRETVIIQYLEELAIKIGKRVGVEILIPIVPTHLDIAGILGTSRQTVTQTLRSLHNQNIIYYDRKRLIIRNSDGKIKF